MEDSAIGKSQEKARAALPRSLWRSLLVFLMSSALAGAAGYAALAQQRLPWAVLFGVLCFFTAYLILGWFFGHLAHTTKENKIDLYDALNDAQGNPLVVVNDQGKAIYGNSSYLELLSSVGVKRLASFDSIYSGVTDFSEPIFQLWQAAREERTAHRDVRVAAGRNVPGAYPDAARWLRLKVSPMHHKGHALWQLQDISADRQHQEQAFSRLQFIITYLDHAPAGFFSTLPNGKVDYVNATLANWLGVDLADAQGSKLQLAELVGEKASIVLNSLANDGHGSRTELLSLVFESNDGNQLPVEVMHRVDFDGDGNALPMRTMVLLRPERARSGDIDAAVRELLSSVPFGVATVSSEGRVMSSNAAFGALAPQLKIGGVFSDALDSSGRSTMATALQAAEDFPGVSQAFSATLTGKTPKIVSLSFVRLPSASDHTLAFAIDETESKALEVQLAQSQKMQAVGQLASGIAHDFNNVLTPIIGFADLLLSKMRPTDPSFADLMNIKQNANRAANLVRQLLAFSRKQTMQPKLHSLTEAMSDLHNLLSRVLGEKTELEIIHGRDLGHVMVDIHQFEQVIINLAVNARDAMAQGGKLSVRTSNLSLDRSHVVSHAIPQGEYVLCEIEDTGSGIPKELLDKIWEPFFSTKDVGKGTGLGLSMVYGIIKQTGGYIFCDSIIGKGTKFSIYLPRHFPEPKVANSVAKEAATAVRADFTGKGRILVVEDEDSVRAFAVRALTSRGYSVLEANSGEVGLEVIESDTTGFELILSDVVMPELDGPSMLAELRKRGIKTKVLFMSGYAEDAFERNLENPDDFAFLQKPFSLKQLIEKVKEVMES